MFPDNYFGSSRKFDLFSIICINFFTFYLAEKYRHKRSSRSASSSRPEGDVDEKSSRNGPEKKGPDTANPPTNTNSNWCTVSLEEEQTTTACGIRSNDSRLYNIPSPSSIPLPPTDSSN